ncbi:neurotrypsin-like [Dreissena polymorpha]|uniref:neurotrypsin-like n=1 Tax=Dreissena polymorpha TaxID=45954 RepID=UPI0022653664|nr:neurotrypsin-like [Dreissena polymorpha]
MLGYDGGKALNESHFGQGSSSILLDEVHCDGTESSIMACRHSGIGFHNCGHHEDASVVCSSKCGRRPLEHYSRQKRIAGGENAEKGFYPWHAGVRKRSRRSSHLCGGIILNDRWILSAAHCFRDDLIASDDDLSAGGDDLNGGGGELSAGGDCLNGGGGDLSAGGDDQNASGDDLNA